MSEHETRRRFLQATGGLTLVALAGCLGDDGDGSDDGMNDAMDDGGMDDDGMNDGGMDDSGMDDGGTDDGDGMDDGDEMEAEPTTFTVRIENIAPTEFYSPGSSTGGAIWITPGAYAVHSGENPVYTAGEAASIGLEALAEAGPPTGFEGEPGLVDELDGAMGVASVGAYTPDDTVADPNDPMGEVPDAPPIAPGGAFEFEIEAEPGQRLSFASMFVPSNDVFFSPGPDGIALFEDGSPVEGAVTDSVGLWDAGTEPNTEPPGTGPDQAPAQESPDQGADEEGVVRRLDAVDDGFDYPDAGDAIQVTVTPE